MNSVLIISKWISLPILYLNRESVKVEIQYTLTAISIYRVISLADIYCNWSISTKSFSKFTSHLLSETPKNIFISNGNNILISG